MTSKKSNMIKTWKKEHSRAFNVAAAMPEEILQALRAGIDHLVATGASLSEARATLSRTIERLRGGLQEDA